MARDFFTPVDLRFYPRRITAILNNLHRSQPDGISIVMCWHQLEAIGAPRNAEDAAVRASLQRDFDEILTTVASLPSLQKVKLSLSPKDGRGIRVHTAEVVARLLNRFPKKIKSLTFTEAILEGTFSDFVEALSYQESLTTIRLQNVSPTPTDQSQGVPALLSAAASLPRLEHFEFSSGPLTFIADNPSAIADALGSLGRSPTLTHLDLNGCCSYRNCDILIPLIQALGDSEFRLVTLNLGGCTPGYKKARLYQSVGHMLQANDTLQLLSLPYTREDDTCILPVIHSLKANRSLKGLEFVENDREDQVRLGEGVCTSLHGVLREYNYTLRMIVFPDLSNYKSFLSCEFYLRLNREKELRLLRNPNHPSTREDWVRALLEHKFHLSTVYFFLRMNPLLVANPTCAAFSNVEDHDVSHRLKRRKFE
ncbi:expressed unknown protein [Seminavis robusta]|uniref:Uncharacterized protein n=1 Tax=Seminavis robusta TaxID=568900 RepID=A0A9N8DI38_9STRA|nr:expressed unknown protein [Seminavis robusta]|eukprot:Sro164_g073520.1 n/a (424) ;mRNA; f:20601-21872